MSTMNYRNITLREIKDYADKVPDYTLGQIFYSILKVGNSANTPLKDLLNLTDEQIYTMLDKAREIEED